MIKSVLVTGAGGYVGGRIARSLAESGYAVRLLSRNADVAARLGLGCETVVTESLEDHGQVAKACRGIDGVVHLAAPNEVEAAAKPEESIRCTMMGTWVLVSEAILHGARRFVYFSTAHVYGVPLEGKIDERLRPRPIHPYAIGHHGAEDCVLAEHHRGLELAVALRTSNIVGAPAERNVNRWTLVANDLCRQAVETGRLVLKSSGLQQRDFIPMTDAVDATKLLLEVSHEEIEDGLMNLSAGRSMRVLDFAGLVAERATAVIGFRPPVCAAPAHEGEVHVPLELSVDRLKSIGFCPRGDLTTAIDETLEFCMRLGTIRQARTGD